MVEKDYDKYYEWMNNSFKLQKKYDLFANYYKKNYLKRIPGNKNIKILDIGCGMGQFLYFLKKAGYKNIEGFDLDKENVEQCHKMGFENVVQADMYEYLSKTKNNYYDLIVMNDIIEHVPREKTIALLENIRTKLKKGGRFMVKTVNCNNVYGLSSYFSDFTHVTGYNSEKMRHVAMLSGFRRTLVYNLYVLPNIPLIDGFFKFLFFLTYKIKRLFFYMNGRVSDNVFSKNLLAVLRK